MRKLCWLFVSVSVFTTIVCAPVYAEDVAASVDATEQGSTLTKLERAKKILSERGQTAEVSAAGGSSVGSSSEPSGVEGASKMYRGLFLCIGVLLIVAHFIKKFSGKDSGVVSERKITILD